MPIAPLVSTPDSTWNIKLKSQQAVAPDPWNLNDILARKNDGTDFSPAPTYNVNDAISRRFQTINQIGDQQNTSVQQAVALKEQKAQAVKLAAAQNDYRIAQNNQTNQGNQTSQSTYTSTGGSDPRSKLVQLASSFKGTPYVWGGESTKGFDCSGLVQYVYGKMGIKMPRVSQQQATMGARTSINNLKPGDLVAWGSSPATATHIAIYAGNGQIWEAAHTGTTVRTRAVSANESGIMGISLKM
jgi:cell wall-associated NlpC family hydrolase